MRTKHFGLIGCIIVLSFPVCVFAQLPTPAGKIVDIGTSKLHINCSGGGAPVVVLESGLPGTSLDWEAVQPEVAKFTTTCSYDRAGLGWSELGKEPRTANQIAEDLHELLRASALRAPYVLVGHSIGGIYVRMFTAKYSAEVIGMVLIDALNGDEPSYRLESFWEPPTTSEQETPNTAEVHRSAEAEAMLKELRATETWKIGEGQEKAEVKASFAEIQESGKRLPLIPLIVLSAGERLTWKDEATASAWTHQHLQRELAALSAQGEWTPVPGCSHYIQLCKPSVVVDAIRRVVDNAKSLRPRTSKP